MDNIKAKELLHKYRQNACTEEEIAQLESWYLHDSAGTGRFDLAVDDIQNAKDKIWTELPVHESIKAQRKLSWLGLPAYYSRIAAAAVLTICVSISFYFLNGRKKQDITAKNSVEIRPGGHKAILTLGDGKTIALTDAQNGVLVQQAGANIIKTADGQLVYNVAGAAEKAIEYHTMSIPRGGYYTLTLSDGTKVWLNAESSLRYPNEFVGNERVVELTGEGYFEVAHRKDQPFKVVTKQQTVEVLGTHFNVNAYGDEGTIMTSLLEGSVKLSTPGGASKMLNPGEQASLYAGDVFQVKSGNVEDAIDWTINEFVFNKEKLSSIMNKVARWYDVDVSCPADLGKLTFSGHISRSKNIHQVLDIVKLTEVVNLKIEGRRITVTK